jgi:hypothetical protein
MGLTMLQRFKDFVAASTANITTKSEQFQVFGSSLGSNSNASSNNNQSNAQKSAEMLIIEDFAAYIQTMSQDANVPKKALAHLTDLLNLAKNIKFDDMTLDNQSLVRRIIQVDSKQLLEVYLSLPKAHAVSVVLENGKTAKQTVIDNVLGLYNRVNQIVTETIEQKTELLLKKQKIAQLKEQRKDFFDL